MLPHLIDEHTPLADVQRQRLLGVDILAGLAGVDGGQHSLEFLSGDDHRIDVFTFQDLLVVLIHWPVAFPFGLERLGTRQVAVGQRHNLPVLGQLIEQQTGPVADADRAHGHALVRPWLAVGREDAGRNEIRDAERSRYTGRTLEHLSS